MSIYLHRAWGLQSDTNTFAAQKTQVTITFMLWWVWEDIGGIFYNAESLPSVQASTQRLLSSVSERNVDPGSTEQIMSYTVLCWNWHDLYQKNLRSHFWQWMRCTWTYQGWRKTFTGTIPLPGHPTQKQLLITVFLHFLDQLLKWGEWH